MGKALIGCGCLTFMLAVALVFGLVIYGAYEASQMPDPPVAQQ